MNSKKISSIANKAVHISLVSVWAFAILGIIQLVAGFSGLVTDQDYMNPYGVTGGLFLGSSLASIGYYRYFRKIQLLSHEGETGS